jgi:hypothetical protein
MIINSVLSGGNSRQDIQLLSSNNFIVKSSGEDIIFSFSYNNVENKKGFAVVYLNGNIIESFEINTNGNYNIDITDNLSETDLYQFKLIVIDENKNISSLNFKILYNFNNLNDMSFVYNSQLSGYVLAFYTGSDTSVIIPPMINGSDGEHPVIRIGEGAFFNNDIIEFVTIPSSVQSIGATAFYSCYNLRSVTVNSETPPVLDGDPETEDSNIFDPYNELSLLRIYVPVLAVSTYKEAQY